MNNKKQRIIIELKQAIVGNGFENTTIDSLLEKTQVNKVQFNNFFKTKEELMYAIIDFESDKLFTKLEKLFNNSTNPLAALNNFFDWKLQYFETNGSMIARLGTELVENEIYFKKKIKKIYGDYMAYIVRLLEDAVDKGQLFETTPVRDLANFIVYSLEGGNMSVTLTNNQDHFKAVIAMIKRVIRSYRNLDLRAGE